jgi:hypothetical protein
MRRTATHSRAISTLFIHAFSYGFFASAFISLSFQISIIPSALLLSVTVCLCF